MDAGDKSKSRKRKSRPRQACTGNTLKYGIATMEEEILLHSKVGGKRVEGGSHCRNINQQNGDVKKEQVKGCGSVNRPTPGSQRPAEPVATGFLRGVNYLIFRGRFWGLGVKPWVVNAGFSQCRAILHGVTIGVAAIFCKSSGRRIFRPNSCG